MIIKKFQAKTESEAVEAAKHALGDNVVIMNVKQLKRKGVLALFKTPLTEITVALEEQPDKETVKKESGTAPAVKPTVITQMKKPDTEALEEKLDSLQSLLVQQMNKPEAVREEPSEKEDIQEHKTEEVSKEQKEMERFIRLLYNTMLDNEVDEKYANQIIEEVEKLRKPSMPFDHVLAGIYQKMILKFAQPEGITPAEKAPRVVIFVGPTGVGKTTTIAKIASQFCVEQKKKVALLTTDTFRIAAAEQLRIYANILEVPFRIIYTTEEIEQAIKDFSAYDYLFVDTSGHSHQNKEQQENVEKLIDFVGKHAEGQVFLVLSATTKYKDLINIVDSYQGIADFGIIFTKLDETTTLGNLLNIKLYTGAPLAYVTCGQNVPEDIEVFNPQHTVKKLLGGKK